eukprot:9507750-Karenia_brevis.AAC.1
MLAPPPISWQRSGDQAIPICIQTDASARNGLANQCPACRAGQTIVASHNFHKLCVGDSAIRRGPCWDPRSTESIDVRPCSSSVVAGRQGPKSNVQALKACALARSCEIPLDVAATISSTLCGHAERA